MSFKSITICLFFFLICYAGSAQKIIVDTTSTNKYLITKPTESTATVEKKEEDLSFSDRAMSIGMGILNRLKARLNLEEATETIKEKGQKYLGKKEEENKPKEAEEKGDG